MTIRELRLAKGWTQGQLSQESGGLSVAAISRMENGEPVAKASFILVCIALGVTQSEVVGVNVATYALGRQKKQSK